MTVYEELMLRQAILEGGGVSMVVPTQGGCECVRVRGPAR